MKTGLGFDISDIYIGRYFSNFTLSLNGSGLGSGLGRVSLKPTPDPNPFRVLFLKPKPNPSLSQVKSGRVGYPQVELNLPSLI